MAIFTNPNNKIEEVLTRIQSSSCELEKLIKTCPKIFAQYHKEYAKAFISAKNSGKLPDGTTLIKSPSDEVAKQIAMSSLPDELIENYYSAKIGMELTVEVARNDRRTLDALKKGGNEVDANDWSGVS